MIEEELQPKTELERAFVQARTWDPFHSWRRGTTDLRSGRISSAVGIYLALARSQALTGSIGESEATLTSVGQYREALSVPDKLSAIRVLCSIMSDVKRETEENLNQQLIQKCLTQSAVGFTAQINEDKFAVMNALALIKKSSEFDVISERLHQTQAAELKEKVELYKSTLGDKEPDDKDLQDIFELGKRLEVSLQTLQLMVDLALFLLDKKHIEPAIHVYEYVLAINNDLSKVSTPAIDAAIDQPLCLLGDKLYVKGWRAEACKCFSTALFVRTRTKNYTDRSLEELVTIASNAVVTAQYEECATSFQNILNLLEVQRHDSADFETLKRHVQIHYHLVSILAKPDAKLDLQSFSSLKELVDQSTKFSGSPYFVDILPHLDILLRYRVDKEYLHGILELLWSSAYDLPVSKIYDTYIQPLSIITEQLLGSSTPKSFEYCSKVFAHLKKSRMENQQLVVYWRILIALRESVDGRNSPSLLPFLASLAQQYFDATNYRDCLDIVERVQQMDLSALSGINIGVVTIPSYVEALVTLTVLQLQIRGGKDDNIAFFVDQITKIVHANLSHEPVNSEIHTRLCEIVSKVSKPNSPKAALELLPILDKILKGKSE